jgi:hypothetical protein
VLDHVIPEHDVKGIQFLVVTDEVEQLSLAQLHHVDSALAIALARGGMCTIERRAVDHYVAPPTLNSARQCPS